MRFNYDLLPGERLTFEEIALRYAQQYPEEKELTARALLSPSTSFRTLKIRAVFAQEESNSPLEDLLFIANDNERKNYLRRFEHYLKQPLFPLFPPQRERETRQSVEGDGQQSGVRDDRSPFCYRPEPAQQPRLQTGADAPG